MTETAPTPTDQQTPGLTSPHGTPAKIQRFKLNHPKNYLAVPLAASADADTDFLIREYAVNLPDRAWNGAVEIGLITPTGEITQLGEATVVTGIRSHGSPREALEAFGELHGSPKRFVDAFPEWANIAKRLAFQYEPTLHLVSFLREQGALHLYEVAWLLWKYDPELVETAFLHPGVTEQTTIDPDTRPASSVLTDASVYRDECTMQYKAFLFHCGIIDDRGGCTAHLDPETDTWRLNEQ